MSLRDKLIESGALAPKDERIRPLKPLEPAAPEKAGPAGKPKKPPSAWKAGVRYGFLLKLCYLAIARAIVVLRYFSATLKWALVKSGPCGYCGKHMKPKELTMDHIVPLSKGGRYSISNIIVCCNACNQSKADMGLETWRKAVNAGQPFYFEDGKRRFFSAPPSKGGAGALTKTRKKGHALNVWYR